MTQPGRENGPYPLGTSPQWALGSLADSARRKQVDAHEQGKLERELQELVAETATLRLKTQRIALDLSLDRIKVEMTGTGAAAWILGGLKALGWIARRLVLEVKVKVDQADRLAARVWSTSLM